MSKAEGTAVMAKVPPLTCSREAGVTAKAPVTMPVAGPVKLWNSSKVAGPLFWPTCSVPLLLNNSCEVAPVLFR